MVLESWRVGVHTSLSAHSQEITQVTCYRCLNFWITSPAGMTMLTMCDLFYSEG